MSGRVNGSLWRIDSFSTIIDEELAKATDRIAKGSSPSTYYDEFVIEQGDKQLDPVAPVVP